MPSNTSMPASPFFKPSYPDTVVVEQTVATPRGRHHHKRNVKVATEGVVENKSSIFGCAANMMTCIVGSGIVGLPYAMQQTGFVAGVGLILLTAMLTEKSLRLLVETAKHMHKNSYEATAEVAFGVVGFRFILINMFVMAYGAMVSYLMITQSCASLVLGVEDPMTQQFVLIGVSLAVQFPLACMRDMADLEKSSGLAVAIDCTIVALVAAFSPWIGMKGLQQNNLLELIETDTVHASSVFVGLGVLSFAFECQEAAFLVAGSLEKPTVARWAKVTSMTLTACLVLAMVCAITGYLGYGNNTKGNILDNLDPASTTSFVAHGMLGATMIATYPLASFVARHVCVVLLFEGRQAHEGGSDSSILNRPDRRILLTLVLYLAALIPATLTKNMGSVLAIAGVIGGSSLAYIGPGMLFVAVHGARFLWLIEEFFYVSLEGNASSEMLSETSALIGASTTTAKKFDGVFKSLLWYLGGFPLWNSIAEMGKTAVASYAEKIAAENTMEPLRIGDVDHTPMEKLVENGGVKEAETESPRMPGATNFSLAHLIRPQSDQNLKKLSVEHSASTAPLGNEKKKKPETNKQTLPSLEPDPQEMPPEWRDFLIAIFYVCFGVVALVAGLLSLSR